MLPRFSVVIPAYNEEQLLGRLLDSLDVARAAYGGVEKVEVVVADNISTDRTVEIATARGCCVVSQEKRVIAAVRNAGARVAHGEILAFIDADSQVHPRTFAEIDRLLATGRVVGGATGVTLERRSLGIVLCYLMMMPVVWTTGMDTGVVFCRRCDFEEIGGYDESRLVAEDIAFLLALKRLGKTRGQNLGRAGRAKVIVSTRKFDEFGDWHYLSMAAEGVRHLMRRQPTEFTDRYWYKPRR
ncbi:MAG: glycosyltransferase [Betaproteobacteria bacterium]